MEEHVTDHVVVKNIEDEMKDSYLRYSLSVIISRALPDARDGLKPSQRRILYAMKQLSLSPSAKHRKCAKICGDTSGDYHPHGEGVIYPTLARLAQEWIMRYTLVDGQGNFGSVDGDPPAAMRYTEARLTHSAMHLMEDLDKDTVDYVSNYDETKQEPIVFPAKFPNLLCNGSSGIAVGMATNIPPHNFGELVEATLLILNKPEATIDEILQIMPGPDFPTGALICGYRGMRDAFYTGRGKIVLRAVMTVEEVAATNRHRVVITELPYGVNKARLVEQMAELVHTKVLSSISDLRDESDKDGLRIVVEVKKGESPDLCLNQLYKFTDLQTSFSANMLALDRGLPRLMNIKQMISIWIDHRIEVIQRRTRYELLKAENRADILKGFLKAIDQLDQVVNLIRNSDNREHAKNGLIEHFTFNVRQATAILELKLYQLTGLEQQKIIDELTDLESKIAWYRSVLLDEKLVRNIIAEELQELKKRHDSPRLSQIIPAEGEFDMEDLIPKEQVVITFSEDDYIKRMPVSQFREQKRGGSGVSGFAMKKEDDSLKNFYIAETHDYLLVFTNLGRCYWLKVWQIPESGRRTKGKPIIQLLEDLQPEEKVATVVPVKDLKDESSYLFFATRQGTVKRISLENVSQPRRKGIYIISFDEGDELISAHLAREEQQAMLFTRNGMAVRFDLSDVRPMGRSAKGVIGCRLKETDYIIGCEIVDGKEDESVLIVCERGFGKRSPVNDFRHTSRGGQGVRSILTSERNGLVVASLLVKDSDSVLMISGYGQTIRIRVGSLRVMGRATQGFKLSNLKENDLLIAVRKIENSEEEQDVTEEISEIVLMQDEASISS